MEERGQDREAVGLPLLAGLRAAVDMVARALEG